MREDRIVSSPFSTYAVDGRQPHVEPYIRGRLISRAATRPAVAVIGTASAIAIAFASGVELPDNAASILRPAASRSDDDGAGQSADTAARPGFSSLLHGSGLAAAEHPDFRAPSGSIGEERLAWSAAGRPDRSDAGEIGRAAPYVNPARAETEAAPSRTPSGFASPAAAGCAPSCLGQQGGQAKSDMDGTAAERAQVSSSAPAPGWREETVLQGAGPAGEGAVRSSASGLVADGEPVSALLADAQPSSLIESTGELVFAESAASHSLAAGPTERGGGEPKAGPLESPRVVVEVDAGLEPIAPYSIAREEAAVGASSRTSQSARLEEAVRVAEPAQAIAHHLERISARYAGAAPVERTATERSEGQAAEQLVGTAAARTPETVSPAEVASVVPIIVQDDELVSIKLGELVSLFEDRLDRPLYIWMKESEAASKFVTMETLAAAGIGAKYDAQTRQVVFSVAVTD